MKTAAISRIIHIALMVLLGLVPAAFTQGQVKFYTQVSESNISARQTFQVQYIIEGTKDIGRFTLPTFTDFKVEDIFDVPITPTINQQTMKLVDTYTKIVILSPRRTGRFTVPGATAQLEGKLMKSNSASVTVQQTGLTAIPRFDDIDTEEESELREGEDIDAKIRKSFFIRAEANKTSCFVGEPIMVVYKAYSRLNANSTVVKRPSLTGFSVLEMVDAYDGKPEVEIVRGVPFYTSIIRKVQLFPLQEGSFVLDAAEIESVIHFVQVSGHANDKDGLRRMLRGSGGKDNANQSRSVLNYRTALRSDPLTIHVKPLPAENQPQGYAGAVGNFSLAVETPGTTIREGDLVKIKLVVNGSGNISLMTAPVIEWPAGVDTADPVVKETINKYIFPATGSKTFEYSFAAPDTGDYIIPAAHLPYYDPVQKIYKIATSNPVTLHVAQVIKTDLGQLAVDTDNSGSSSRHLYWFALVVLVIVGWLTWQTIHLKKGKRAAGAVATTATDPQQMKKSAVEEALFKAQWALERGKPQLFYHELEEALWQVIAVKYNVLPSALNKHNAAQHLKQKGVSAEIIKDFSAVLDEVEWALYTPDQSAHDMGKLLGKAREILENIERA